MTGSLVPVLGLLSGSALASGLPLYATIAVLGFLGRTGTLHLPPGLEVLTNKWVIVTAAGLYLIEFLADKVPVLDSIWDMFHTFIRAAAASA